MKERQKNDIGRIMREMRTRENQEGIDAPEPLLDANTAKRNKIIDEMTRREVATTALDLGMISSGEASIIDEFEETRYEELLKRVKQRIQLLIKK